MVFVSSIDNLLDQCPIHLCLLDKLQITSLILWIQSPQAVEAFSLSSSYFPNSTSLILWSSWSSFSSSVIPFPFVLFPKTISSVCLWFSNNIWNVFIVKSSPAVFSILWIFIFCLWTCVISNFSFCG